jgi:iron complex transport system ATP-binding protein
MAEQNVLRTEGLGVGYNGQQLIAEISMAVQPGTVLTLIGPNGSGKSTILKTLAQYLAPTDGAVFIDGQPLARVSAKQLSRTLSVVLTQQPHTDLLTCRDVVASGRHPYTGRLGLLSHQDHRAVRSAMQLLDAWQLRDKDFSRISDGQRQRVLIARALCQDPQLIVLDEPTAYLDVRYKLELLSILRQLATSRGITVLMSLHELDIAQKISDLVMVVNGDRIAHFGEPGQIFRGSVIDEIFQLDRGSYDPLFGSLEFAAPTGAPKVFVVAGAGSGAPVFRLLQRQGIPFATGVLNEGDIDHRLAGSLAQRLFSVPAFEPVGGDALADAADQIRRSAVLVNCLERFGTLNYHNHDLVALADRLGIPVLAPGDGLAGLTELLSTTDIRSAGATSFPEQDPAIRESDPHLEAAR